MALHPISAKSTSPTPFALRLDLALCAAAALSLTAATIHLWVAPEHFMEWWGYGVFFLVAVAAQGLYGVTLLRWPWRPLLFLGIAGNLGAVALYTTALTAGAASSVIIMAGTTMRGKGG